MILIMLVLAVVVVVLTLLLASALGALVRFRPALMAPIQVAMSGVATMVALMAVLVAVTR
ncbi:hypothetical protein ACFYO2_17380 [Streptomyces sp. NPDC006602]|uniref:hypothetical protein n=1 Tax=Streptomyces sp. NPDC006602 TaxID=3364751 RepID=UPI0036BF0D75